MTSVTDVCTQPLCCCLALDTGEWTGESSSSHRTQRQTWAISEEKCRQQLTIPGRVRNSA